MKKIFLFIIFAMAFVGLCAAQNANVERLMVGTWVNNDNVEYVFSADGKITIKSDSLVYNNGVYTGTKMYLNLHPDSKPRPDRRSYEISDISVSSDGKLMIVSRIYNGEYVGYVLRKK